MTIRATRVLALPLVILALLLTGVGSAPPVGEAQGAPLLTQAELFLELNDTDGDLGIHGSNRRRALDEPRDRRPGRTALASALQQRTAADSGYDSTVLRERRTAVRRAAACRIPPTLPGGPVPRSRPRRRTGAEFETTATLSHVLAAPPDNITLSGTPLSEDCDANVPLVATPIMVEWDPVTSSHPEMGKRGQVRINRYQVFVEREGVNLAVDLPPNVTKFEVPTGITALGGQFKFEIIAGTTKGNNTAVESCFRVR